MEPDDRIALILLASLDPDSISLVGATGLHAGRKAALARQLMDQLGLPDVPVVQGSGGLPESYPDIASNLAALSYQGEGEGLLSETQLKSLSRDVPRSSDDLQNQIRHLLQSESNVEIILLAPATDLVLALESDPALMAKVKRIHVMGGWTETVDVQNTPERWTSFNWNMDPQAAARLVQMRDIPMTLYSSHMLQRDFAGGSINRDNFPEIIEFLEEEARQSQWAKSFFVASRSWDENVMKQIPYLVPIIGDRAGQQFTPADPIVILGLRSAELATEVRSVDITIDLEDMDRGNGYKVLVQENPASNITSIETIDRSVFLEQALSMLRDVATKND